MKFNTISIQPRLLTKVLFYAFVFFQLFCSSCSKKDDIEKIETGEIGVNSMASNSLHENGRNRTNPLSKKNVRKAREKLNIPTLQSTSKPVNEGITQKTEDEYIYLKFNPQNIAPATFLELERDSTIMMLDFPFGDGNMYGTEVTYDENYLNTLRDGNIYAVVPNGNRIISTLTSEAALQTQVLDTIVDINPKDTVLMTQLLIEANFIDSTEARLIVCGFRQPRGFVRYWDTQTQNFLPARGMQVWSLNFGIKRVAYADNNGFYSIPAVYSIGAIIGTHAKNPRVNIKPLNTVGGALQVIPQLILNFIIGSETPIGFFSACQMRNDININFANHTQARYWAHLLNSVNRYDNYSQTFNIPTAPWGLVVYANWADAQGDASATMLGHIKSPANPLTNLVTNMFIRLLGVNPNAIPNLFNLMLNILPDMSFRESVNELDYTRSGYTFSEDIMQTAFHELGHGSHYMNVGDAFWINLGVAIMNAECPGYGCGTEPGAGIINISEGWAEFIGTFYALRFHPNGRKISRQLSTFNDPIWQAVRHDVALENERWFFQNWINNGFFNDLMDGPVAGTTPIINNPLEGLDVINGVTLQQLYNPLQPDVRSACQYLTRFNEQNPGISFFNLTNLFGMNNVNNCPL